MRASEANSHSKRGWEEFTDKVVDVIDKYGGANLHSAAGCGRGVVFMAWGAPAAKRVAKLDKVRVYVWCAMRSMPKGSTLLLIVSRFWHYACV